MPCNEIISGSFLRYKVLLAVALIVILSAVPYLEVLDYGFVWDDEVFIEKNPAVHTLLPVQDYFTESETLSSQAVYNQKIYRPVRTLLFALLHSAFGLDPAPFHLLNLLLHMTCSVLVLLVGMRLNVDFRGSLIGAVLFAVHPVHAEAVVWISSLAEVLFAALYLLAILMFLSAHRAAKAVAVLVLFPLALFSKETAITLPAVFLVLTLWRSREQETVGGRQLLPAAVAFGIAGLYFIWRTHVLSAVAQEPVTFEWVQAAFLRVHLVIMEYFKMILMPVSLCSMRSPIFPDQVSVLIHVSVVLGLILIAVAIGMGIRQRHLSSLLVILMLIVMLPILNFLPIIIQVAERFAYLPSVWICLLTGKMMSSLFERVQGSARFRCLSQWGLVIMIGAPVIWMTVHLMMVNKTWRSSLTVALAQVQCDEPEPNAYWNLGNEAADQGDLPLALSAFTRYVELVPRYSPALNNLAWVNGALKNWKAAEELSRRSLEISPDDIMALNNLAAALNQQERPAEALEACRRIIAIDPAHYSAHINAVLAFIMLKQPREASEFLLAAEKLNPAGREIPALRRRISQLINMEVLP